MSELVQPSSVNFPAPASAAPAAEAPSTLVEAPAGGPGQARQVLAERWPALSRALGQYQQNTAELFSQMAYDAIDAGLIRHDQRLRLAAAADAMGIRPFDAQLLIACAIRQWALDRQYDSAPSLQAPALSFEYKSWRRAAVRAALFLGAAAALDLLLLIKWLS